MLHLILLGPFWFIYWCFTGKETLAWIRYMERAEYQLAAEEYCNTKIYKWLKKINDKRRY